MSGRLNRCRRLLASILLLGVVALTQGAAGFMAASPCGSPAGVLSGTSSGAVPVVGHGSSWDKTGPAILPQQQAKQPAPQTPLPVSFSRADVRTVLRPFRGSILPPERLPVAPTLARGMHPAILAPPPALP